MIADDRARAPADRSRRPPPGFVLRLAFGLLYWTGKPLTHDEREYLALASSLAAGRGFVYDATRRDRHRRSSSAARPAIRCSSRRSAPAATRPPARRARVKIAQALVGARRRLADRRCSRSARGGDRAPASRRRRSPPSIRRSSGSAGVRAQRNALLARWRSRRRCVLQRAAVGRRRQRSRRIARRARGWRGALRRRRAR